MGDAFPSTNMTSETVPSVSSSFPSPPGATSPTDSSPPPSADDSQKQQPRAGIPSLRPIPGSNVTTGSPNPLGAVNAARGVRPVITTPFSPSSPAVPTTSSFKASALPTDMQARLKAFHASRKSPASPAGEQPQANKAIGGSFTGQGFAPPAGTGGMKNRLNRPSPQNWTSAPQVPSATGRKRPDMKLPGGLPGASPMSLTAAPDINGVPANPDADKPAQSNGASGSMFDKFSEYVDTKTGKLTFAGKATIHGGGVEFSSGTSFNISLDQVESLDELGKGNYGTVYKVIHRKPKARMPGAGVASIAPKDKDAVKDLTAEEASDLTSNSQPGTGVIMAMKEIRLELDEAKFAAIIMELDILHRCVSPYIIDFYGAFFQEGAVYICIEFMDGGSMDKIYGEGVPESVLRKVTWATVMGLKSLKEDHKIIHRDVKPTNILVNSKGEVKLCDFGVSGNLVASIAKTNIGCQSYMAPERIASGGMAQSGGGGDGTYGVQSDVWSLGLSILECAMGRYPYPPETYNNIFSQLSAIVDGAPPDLPDTFTTKARDFVRRTLHKIPAMRPTYSDLLRHPWIADMHGPGMIMEEDEEEAENETTTETIPSPTGLSPTGFKEVQEWVIGQMEKRKKKVEAGEKWGSEKPALHTVALDQVKSPNEDASNITNGINSLEIKTA